ncbi:type II restriction enzyme [Alicycliphilus sp. B1]|nr:type II restriction enzyme [Alicycliphilus sp. B1]
MALDLVNYEQKAHEAVKAFWGNREAARQKQIESGKADQGERAGVTGGKNMDGFLALVLGVSEFLCKRVGLQLTEMRSPN